MRYTILSQNKDVEQQPVLKQLCKRLLTWLMSNKNVENVLIPYIVHDTHVSKRLIYWTVSNYAQTRAISIIQSKHVTNVFEQYSNHLRMFNRRLFDVFCRQPFGLELEMTLEFALWQKVKQMFAMDIDVQEFVHKIMDGQCVVRTSLAQLNFFHWASTNGILAYIRKYESSLLQAMKSDSRKRRMESSDPASRQAKPTDKRRKRHGKTVTTQPVLVFYRPCAIPI